MKRLAILSALFLVLLPSFTSCTIHSIAREWNGRIGRNGKPMQAITTTKFGLQLVIAVPFIGDCRLPGMVDEATKRIKENGGDRVEIAYFHTDNYWASVPPLSWFLTPVWSQITVEFEPSDEPKN